MPTSAELATFFSSLRSEPELQRLIDDRVKENIYLEFKQKKDRSHGALDESDKFQFSRAVSGFANSDAGVLVWGVATDGEECAHKLKPIRDVSTFHAALKKSILHTTQPVVDDIAMEIVPSAAGTDEGYVRCLIPRSEKTPHRAMLAGREYYKRTTEGFYKLEHFDLEDMFGRRPVPFLGITTQLRAGSSSSGTGGRTQDILVELTVRNDGRGSARAPFIEAIASPGYEVRPNNISSGSPESPLHWLSVSGSHGRFLGRADFIIHPQLDFTFAVVMRRFRDREVNTGDLSLTCRLAADNALLREVCFDWKVDELLRFVKW